MLSILKFRRADVPAIAIAVVVTIAALAAVILIGAPEGQTASNHAPVPASGSIDLVKWDFGKGGSVSLAGGWRFEPAFVGTPSATMPGEPMIIPVPGYWPAHTAGQGSSGETTRAAYSLRLRLPVAPSGQRFALETGYWLSAYRVYANGELLLDSGRVSDSAEAETANAYSKIVTLPRPSEVIELRFEVSNHLSRFGGSFVAPRIGFENSIRDSMDLLRAMSTFLVGSMFFAALYHLMLFFLDRSAPAKLWFACFAALLCIRTLTIAPLAIFAHGLIGQDWVWRIDYASSMLLLPACYQFFLNSFPRQVSARVSPWLWTITGTFSLLTLITGPLAGELGMKAVEALAAPFIVYLFASLARGVIERELGAALALAGWILCAAASIHDILLDNMLVAGTDLIPFGFFGFFLCNSGMMAARFQHAFRDARRASRRLQQLNDELESAVQARTFELKVKLDELGSKQTELVRAREEAETANTAKSKFLATMSHELRTPLNSILGFSEIIRDERVGQIGDQRYCEFAGHINESGTHLLSLIGDILDLSRIESGRLELQFEELSVEDIAHAAMHRAATRQRRASDAVEIRRHVGLPMLSADRRAFMQMLINLISNALKFTPDGGKITVSAFVRDDGGMTVQVADVGIGMAAEDIPKAMMAFSQVDDNLSRRHEGSGLGLTIVKSFMEQHSGAINIQSEKGRGTTVSLEFPACRVVALRRETAVAIAGD